tara:strand:+ start:2693 stop:3550 length:858 start_codon:yes stop_codon:yes gene_type:complete
MVRFSIIGDMGSGNIYQYKVANSLKYIIDEFKSLFVCGLGDNIYDSGCICPDDKQFITKFEKPYSKISDNIKFFMCLGNHDYGKYMKIFNVDNSINQIIYSKLSQEKNKKWILPDKYYTFKKGNIQFYVLDTNIDRMTTPQIKKQLRYIKKKIRESKSKWNIVYGHHTWRSVGGHGNAEPILENFFKSIFNTGKIDLYMCGHDHSKQFILKKLPKNNSMHLMVCGTGGKNTDYFYNPDNLNENDSKLLHFSDTFGTAFINSNGNNLEIQFFNLKKPEFKYTIKKK